MLDLGGFFTSTEVVGQFAAIIAAILSAFVGQFLGNLFAG